APEHVALRVADRRVEHDGAGEEEEHRARVDVGAELAGDDPGAHERLAELEERLHVETRALARLLLSVERVAQAEAREERTTREDVDGDCGHVVEALGVRRRGPTERLHDERTKLAERALEHALVEDLLAREVIEER